jgi:hypothetical protein
MEGSPPHPAGDEVNQVCVCDREQRRVCPNCDSLGCPRCLEERALNEQADGYRAAIKLHIDAANELRSQLATVTAERDALRLALGVASNERDDAYVEEDSALNIAVAARKAEAAANVEAKAARTQLEQARALLDTATRLARRLFATTKHFSECVCVTCEDARALLAPKDEPR